MKQKSVKAYATGDGQVNEYGKYKYLVSFGNLYKKSRSSFTGWSLVSSKRTESGILDAIVAYELEINQMRACA